MLPYETRSAEPIERRDEDGGGDQLASATAAVEELRSAVEQHRTATDQRLSTELRSITERLDALDVRMQRPGSGMTEQRNEAAEIERRAFVGFARHGAERFAVIAPEEARTLRVADNTAGGYLAPEQFVAELIRDLVEFSPIRQAARVGQASAGSVVLPKRTGRMTAKWVGETETRPATEPTYGQLEIPIHEIACYVDVSNRLLEDAAVNLEEELRFDFAEEFGRLEGEAFVNGDGNKKPVGIMADPAVAYTANGHATNLGADALISLMYAVPAAYRRNGAWLVNGTTLATVRKLKDGQGNYLWQPSYQAGEPETLLGRPVVEAVDMDDVASGTFPIAFGDFAAGYRIYDRIELSVLRDPFTQQTNGIVRFHGRRRVGAAVVRPDASRKLKMATS
jgi:HK97 family phage major capsid protein